jgi:hypothetical protein
MRLTGLRGVGKSVLLDEFETIATKAGWLAGHIELQAGHNQDDTLVSSLHDVVRNAKQKLSAGERIKQAVGKAARTAGGLGVGWNDFVIQYQPFGDSDREDLGKALYETTDLALTKGRDGFILLLDEAQILRDEKPASGEHPLSLLISAVVALQRREIPVGLVLCGLPTLTGNLLRARSYTERMFRAEEIGRLDHSSALDAFTKPLEHSSLAASDDLIEAVVADVERYPYFIQLWGSELWDAATFADVSTLTTELLSAARPEIYRRLDLEFYEPRVSTLTPAEQDVLLATAAAPYPPLVVADLNKAVKKTPQNINVLLGRLVEAGVLYRIRKAEYDYTAPKFRDYLLRRTAVDLDNPKLFD